MMKCAVGIDLGGTKIYFALISEKGEIITEFRDDTQEGGKLLLEKLISGTEKLLKKSTENNYQVKAIGIGSPGRVDAKEGIVVDCTPNIKDWQGTNIKKIFEEKFHIPTFVDNDANVAAYGEYYLRKLEGLESGTSIVLTLGTGLGSGVIYNNKLFRGKGLGSEIGHMIIDSKGRKCTCGQVGCFERYVSGVALELEAKERLYMYPDSILNNFSEEKISSYRIFESASKGDLFSKILIDEMAEYLAIGLISLINIFDPDLILLSGGISNQKDMYIEKVIHLIEKNLNYASFDKNIIQIAKSNDKAGLIGAGLIAFYGFNEGEI